MQDTYTIHKVQGSQKNFWLTFFFSSAKILHTAFFNFNGSKHVWKFTEHHTKSNFKFKKKIKLVMLHKELHLR